MMSFEIHLPTLLLMSVTLNVVIGALLWWIYRLRGRQNCFRLWALACFLFAGGSLLAGARVAIDAPFITVFAAHGLLGLSPLLVLAGLQGFSRLPAKAHRRFRWFVAVGFSVYLILLLGTFHLSAEAPRAITAIFSALVFSVAVYRLSAIAAKVRMPLRVLQVLFTVHGILMMIQALVIAVNAINGTVHELALILRLILINHILLATGTALALPLMAFSLSERRLRDLAERDPLTGLFNRRSLLREGARAFSRARAGGTSLAVLMLDLDHFKTINDRWGHSAGDEALRVVAKTLTEELREDDIIGRIGGEEFSIVLPLSADEDFPNIANRVLTAIAIQGVEIQGKPMNLSASIGCIEMAARHRSFADLMLEADSALYTAKNNGRNRAEFSTNDTPVTI